MIEAVVFDLDGIIVDSEHVWDDVRQELAEERGGRWHDEASRDMMGMSSPEWSRYMHDVIGLAEPPEEINAEVVRRMEAGYRERLPLIPGAVEAVQRLAARWPLGLASSSNRELIDLALEASGLEPLFATTVSSEEVARGKPAPGRLPGGRAAPGRPPRPLRRRRGLGERHPQREGRRDARARRSPTRSSRPPAQALAEADLVLASIAELTPEAVEPG